LIMFRLLTAAALLFVSVVHSAHKDRHEQISRMKQYTTTHLVLETVDDNTVTVEFDAFGQHYSVEFWRQIHAAPANVVHTNVDSAVHSPLSSRSESCQFHGRVLNAEGVSIVSASFCEGHGIRARISAFGEILIIKPSAYYLDLAKDALANHSLSDEVLIYRVSDFDRPAITGTEGVSDYLTMDDDVAVADDVATRRRLYSASSPGQTEVSVLIGPVRTANYQADYGDNWYSQLYADTAYMMNAVDAIYAATNWNAAGRSSVGTANSLRVVFSEIHVIYSFTGDYTSMAPEQRYSSCTDLDDSDYCAIYGADWLGKIKSWVYYNMDSAQYDNVQMITDIKFDWTSCTSSSGSTYVCSRTLGWGNIGVVCRGSGSVSTNSVVESFGGNENAIGTIAHELGHNFGLYHDGQSGPAASCGANDGLMGYGNNDDEFSTCSLDGMEDYFNGNGNGLACLGTGWDGVFVSNVESDDTAVTPSPTVYSVNTASPTNPTAAPSPPTPSPTYAASDGCVHIELGYSNFDGTWDAIDGGYDGKEAYTISKNGNDRYLYYKELSWGGLTLKWIMGPTLGENSVYFFCDQDYLMECGGNWIDITGSDTYTIFTASVTDSECTPTGDVDTSCDSFSCIYVTGSTYYDGYYSATSDCLNEKRVYTNTNGEFLCYNDGYGRWMFSEEESCSLDTVASERTEGDPTDSTWWLISRDGSTSRYKWSSSVYVSDCGTNGELNAECLDDSRYQDSVCISTGSEELWGSDRTFTVYEELCSNEEPIFQFEVYNNSKSMEFDGAVVDGEAVPIEATFYLHYQPEYLLTTDSEKTGQWMLTKNEISVNYLALCQQEDLRDCAANQWKLRLTEYGEDDPLDGEFGGIIVNVLSEFMTVTDGSCGSTDGSDEANVSSPSTIAVIIVVILVAVLAVGALCLWRRMSRKQSVSVTFEGQHSLPTGTGAEEAEPEVEVEVTMEQNTTATFQ